MVPAVGEYAGGQGFPLPNPVSMHREYPRSRLWIEWCMQLFKKRRYLARDFKALRCRIRYSSESIQGAVVQMRSRAFPTAILTCSTRTGTTMVELSSTTAPSDFFFQNTLISRGVLSSVKVLDNIDTSMIYLHQ